MGNTLQPHTVPPGWFLRWWRASWALQKEAPAAFGFLLGLTILLNLLHQPLILTIPFSCLELALIFSTAMTVELGGWSISDVVHGYRDVPWLAFARLLFMITVLILGILLFLFMLRHYLHGILTHGSLSTAATLKHLHTPAWNAMPLWLKFLISNSLGNAQVLLGNTFLMLSVGVVSIGMVKHGYLALYAGFQAVLRNIRVWLVFVLASLLLQGMMAYLSVQIHRAGAAALVAALAVILLQWVGLYGWQFTKETFGLPTQRVYKRARARAGKRTARTQTT